MHPCGRFDDQHDDPSTHMTVTHDRHVDGENMMTHDDRHDDRRDRHTIKRPAGGLRRDDDDDDDRHHQPSINRSLRPTMNGTNRHRNSRP